MKKMVLGVFSERDQAEDAIRELEYTGYPSTDISVIMKDKSERMTESTGANVAGGAATGATTGGVLGGLAGLLIGLGAIAVPGVGALLIGGPIAAALGLTGVAATTVSGVVTGALAGGLVGGLMALGVPEEDARIYERRIREGAILVLVPVTDSQENRVKEIMSDYEADQIRSISSKEPVSKSSRDWEMADEGRQAYHSDVRRHDPMDDDDDL